MYLKQYGSEIVTFNTVDLAFLIRLFIAGTLPACFLLPPQRVHPPFAALATLAEVSRSSAEGSVSGPGA